MKPPPKDPARGQNYGRLHRGLCALVILALLLSYSQAWAAIGLTKRQFDMENLPVIEPSVDFNGVDPASGSFGVTSPFDLTVPAAGHLGVRSSFNGRSRTSSVQIYLEDETYIPHGNPIVRHIKVHVRGRDKLFTCDQECVQDYSRDGSRLFRDPEDHHYILTDGEGVRYDFFPINIQPLFPPFPCADWDSGCNKVTSYRYAFVSQVTYPSGEKHVYHPEPEQRMVDGAEFTVYTIESNLGFRLELRNKKVESTDPPPEESDSPEESESPEGYLWLNLRRTTPGYRFLYYGDQLIRSLTSFQGHETELFELNGAQRKFKIDYISGQYEGCSTPSGGEESQDQPFRNFYRAVVPARVESPAGVVTTLSYGSSPNSGVGTALYHRDSNIPVQRLRRGDNVYRYVLGFDNEYRNGTANVDLILEPDPDAEPAPRSFRRAYTRPVKRYDWGANDQGCSNAVMGKVGDHVLKYELGVWRPGDDWRGHVKQRTSYVYGGAKVVDTRFQEKNGYCYGYDERGNLTDIHRLDKAALPQFESECALDGSPVFQATYEDCDAFPLTCNKPRRVQNARGLQYNFGTDYTYSEVHGGVTSVTQPPDVNGIRPQVRYHYTAHALPDGSVIYRQTGTSQCMKGAAAEDGGCELGPADEVITVTTYWGNTFLPETKTVRSGATTGSAAVSATVAYEYTTEGYVRSITDELGQKTYLYHDKVGRKIGEVTPDPDGNGPLPHLATRTTYNGDDQIIKVETGTIAAPPQDPESVLSGLSVTQKTDTYYNNEGLKAAVVVSGGGEVFSVTQQSYDGWEQPECSTVRMNVDQLNLTDPLHTLPHACEITTGPEGEDRITRNAYDDIWQLSRVEKGYGSAWHQDYTEYRYTGNGKKKHIIDANGNLTSLDYDTFDRLERTSYPHPETAKREANSADAETYVYDLNDNLVKLTRRDRETVIDYDYDYLDRRILEDVYVSFLEHPRSVFYEYDLRGNQTLAAFVPTHDVAAGSVEQVYNALNQMTDSTVMLDGITRHLSYEHNAKLRTAVTHPDGEKFSYTHDAAHRLKAITHPSAGTLAEFSYDAQGRPDVWAGGIRTQHQFDAAGRLKALQHDLMGQASDNAYGYDYNPASQITRIAATNAKYAPSTMRRSVNYEPNGLNQIVNIDGQNRSYDPNGNLSQDGFRFFKYDHDNRLVKMTKLVEGDTEVTQELQAELWYDPLGRLFKQQSAAGTTYFLYDGDELIAEYDGASGEQTNRYVHGISIDDPVAWFSGPEVEVSTRRHLRTNHQGSIVAVSDAAGRMLHLPQYDSWGAPVGEHPLRFGYTGQVWLPEIGLWHYKARMYDPQQGRFLQTDPVGYEDQMNLYAYVGNDPVGRIDPSGETLHIAAFAAAGAVGGAVVGYLSGGAKGAISGALGGAATGALLAVAPAAGLGVASFQGVVSSLAGLGVTAGTNMVTGGPAPTKSDLVSAAAGGAAGPTLGKTLGPLTKPGLPSGAAEAVESAAAGVAGAGVGYEAGWLSQAEEPSQSAGPKGEGAAAPAAASDGTEDGDPWQ